MANAKKCDRCGKYYDCTKANRMYKMEKLNSCGYFIVDLCEACHASIVDFMTYAYEKCKEATDDAEQSEALK